MIKFGFDFLFENLSPTEVIGDLQDRKGCMVIDNFKVFMRNLGGIPHENLFKLRASIILYHLTHII